MSDSEPFSSGSSDYYQPPDYDLSSTSSSDDGRNLHLSTSQNQSNENIDQGMNISDESNINNPSPSTSGIISKKRKSANPSEWKRNVMKKSIATGKRYLNYKGQEIGERKTGPDCCCKKYKCFVQINEEARKQILENFNKLEETYVQNVYLGGLIKTGDVERERSKTGTGKKRSCSHKYYIKLGNKNIQVCRNGFASIHGISKKRVDNIAKEYRDPTVSAPSKSKRGKHQNRPNRISTEWVSKVDSHIRSFPRRESHYSRNKSSRYYLSPELNIKRMYDLYLKQNEPGLEASAKPIVSFDFYYRYFKQNFKYSFGSPRSDTCKKCDMLDNKLKDKTLDSDETKQIQLEKSLHQAKGDTFFVDLKEKSKLAVSNDECEVLTFDYQQNMPLPKIPAGEAFYKRQLWAYNFCIHSAKTGIAHFYLYDETIARKSPNEVISFINHYIDNILPSTVKRLYLFSDNAAAQNKNSTLVQYLYTLVRCSSIEEIVHRFPEPGHSFLPCDRCFGVIEKYNRKKDYIFTTSEYSECIKQASKNFKVVNADQNMILNFTQHYESHFKKIITNAEKIRFKISQYRIFQYSKDHIETIAVSVTTGTPVFDYFQTMRNVQANVSVLPQKLLYDHALPLKKAKYKDVMQLVKNYVPPNKLFFYRALKSETVGPSDDISSEDDDDQAEVDL